MEVTILGSLFDRPARMSSRMGSALSSSTYNRMASSELCLVAALAEGRPFSMRGVMVALRDLSLYQFYRIGNPVLMTMLPTSYMLALHHISRKNRAR